ncbi:MAG: FKBP-type peptidyl-prolyl cis-trans isomerase [Cyclobacteriaceae bacterium]|nr:FKBP-type peptidyl-prolyl cis-trans isomerase [Cyclobacteriaceae bacterium]
MLLFVSSGLKAQVCEHCLKLPSFTADHCYNDSRFPAFCVQFSEKEDHIIFHRGKKGLDRLPFPDRDSTDYYLALLSDKKLKLNAHTVLFLQQAFISWDKVKRDVGMQYTESGLGIKIVKQGEGDKPVNGQKVKVHYTGTLADGTRFDSSIDRGVPFEFPLGAGRVIKGWDEGISLLNIGSTAIIKVPPELGYGLRGAGNTIPPNATLYFEVELIDAE